MGQGNGSDQRDGLSGSDASCSILLGVAFEAIQILFWLSLSTWFGGVLFVTLAPPLILRTVRANNPVLPTVLSVNLEGQHGTLLASSIISSLIEPLMRIELACAAGVLIALIGQWSQTELSGGTLYAGIFRSALYVLAVAFLMFRWRVVWPRLLKHRQEYVDHADEPEIANPALDRFDRDQSEVLALLRNLLFALVGLILFSANIHPSVVVVPMRPAATASQ
jgi:hypothetical protein